MNAAMVTRVMALSLGPRHILSSPAEFRPNHRHDFKIAGEVSPLGDGGGIVTAVALMWSPLRLANARHLPRYFKSDAAS